MISDFISKAIFAVCMLFVFGFFGYIFLIIPVELLREWIFQDINVETYYSIVIPVIILAIIIYICKEKYKRCPHGVFGGNSENACPKCIDDKEKQLREIEERTRLAEIRRNSEELRRKELQRLREGFYKKLDYLYSLSPQQFESVVMDMFRKLGYSVKQTPFTNDRGKDGIAFRNNHKYLIECKRYEINKRIGRPMLQKFFAAMYEEKASKGFFVTTAKFADTAYEYARINNIELIDGERLIDGMNKAFPEQKGNDTIQVMCLKCGDIVSFNLSSKISKGTCINGHTVDNNITYDKLAQEVKIYM